MRRITIRNLIKFNKKFAERKSTDEVFFSVCKQRAAKSSKHLFLFVNVLVYYYALALYIRVSP